MGENLKLQSVPYKLGAVQKARSVRSFAARLNLRQIFWGKDMRPLYYTENSVEHTQSYNITSLTRTKRFLTYVAYSTGDQTPHSVVGFGWARTTKAEMTERSRVTEAPKNL